MNTSQQPEVNFGNSVKMQKLLAQIRRVAVTDVPVLLVGEKGTGKNFAAHVINELSPRHKNLFTEVNCSLTRDVGIIGNALLGKGAPVASRQEEGQITLQRRMIVKRIVFFFYETDKHDDFSFVFRPLNR